MFNLEGKNAFISGASRGLGRQFANALAKAGANVVITSRTLESLESTKQEIEAIGSCLLYTSPSPRDATLSRMPSSA